MSLRVVQMTDKDLTIWEKDRAVHYVCWPYIVKAKPCYWRQQSTISITVTIYFNFNLINYVSLKVMNFERGDISQLTCSWSQHLGGTTLAELVSGRNVNKVPRVRIQIGNLQHSFLHIEEGGANGGRGIPATRHKEYSAEHFRIWMCIACV